MLTLPTFYKLKIKKGVADMEKEKFEKIENYARELRQKYKKYSHRAGALMGIVQSWEDLTHEEILKIMEILFL